MKNATISRSLARENRCHLAGVKEVKWSIGERPLCKMTGTWKCDGYNVLTCNEMRRQTLHDVMTWNDEGFSINCFDVTIFDRLVMSLLCHWGEGKVIDHNPPSWCFNWMVISDRITAIATRHSNIVLGIWACCCMINAEWTSKNKSIKLRVTQAIYMVWLFANIYKKGGSLFTHQGRSP